MRESAVERYLVKRVKAAGGRCEKVTGVRNFPDRIVIWPGRIRPPERDGATGWQEPAGVDFVETKAPGKKPRAGQARCHRDLRRMGAYVRVVDTKGRVDSYVDARRTS